MTDVPPLILQTAGAPAGISSSSLSQVTNGLLPPRRLVDRLANFGENAYDLSDTSHLVRLMKTLLGDAGAGQLRKRLMFSRLQSSINGSHFFDLDGFWGALFTLRRRSDEILSFDPTTVPATKAQWADARAKDASYRSRIQQFGRAIGYGATPLGMRLIAEAILNCPCQVFESYLYADQYFQTIAQMETAYPTVGAMDGVTIATLEGQAGTTVVGGVNRVEFVIQPSRALTGEEAFDLATAITKLKPAHAVVNINAGGVELHSPVLLRGVGASSEYWDITTQVKTQQIGTVDVYSLQAPDPTEQPRPPFNGYQGEQWTYNNSIVGTIAYVLDASGNPVVGSDEQRQRWNDGTWTDYVAGKAALPGWQSLLGRSVSDGVLASNVISGRPPAQGTYIDANGNSYKLSGSLSTAGIYVDGVPLDTAVQALGQTSFSSLLQAQASDQDFWSTPARPASSTTQEVLEIRYGLPAVINTIRFSLPHFPHTCAVEYFDEKASRWVTIDTKVVTDSSPGVFSDSWSAMQNHQHPHHTGAGHWIPFEIDLGTDPVVARRVRFRLQRLDNGNGPKIVVSYYSAPSFVNVGLYQSVYLSQSGVTTYSYAPNVGQPFTVVAASPLVGVPGVGFGYFTGGGGGGSSTTPQDYELGALGVDIGYSITSKDALPVLPDVIATATDLFGSSIQFVVNEERASGLMAEPPKPWRCEPQPVPNAVVNFFFDTRTPSGAGQVVDRFFVDPTHLGVTASLYYSNDDPPSGSWTASDDFLPDGVVTFAGTITDSQGSLNFDAAESANVTVDNRAVQFNPGRDWWVGLSFVAGAPSNSALTLLDLGGNRITVVGNQVTFTASSGDVTTVAAPWGVGASVQIVAGYLPLSLGSLSLVLWVIVNGAGNSQQAVVLGNMGAQPAYLCIGGGLGSNPGISGMQLQSFILKQAPSSMTDLAAFLVNPSAYSTKGAYRGQDDGTTDNAILRFDPSFISSSYPAGLVGGPPQFYDGITWRPVLRDYALQKGYIEIPPTQAKFFKFEMTNLVAEPYETYMPMSRQVTLFSPGTTTPPSFGSSISTGSAPSEAAIQQVLLSGQPVFNDSQPSQPQPVVGPSNPATSTLYSSDPEAAAALAKSSYVLGFQAWQQGVAAPQFETISKHSYQVADVPSDQKVGYFCGLNSITAYRLDFDAGDDTDQYRELFYDGQHIASNTWIQNPSDLSTASLTPPVVAVSTVFNSTHPVAAVQFATQQKPPLQLVPDDDFVDPRLANTNWTDPGGWQRIGDSLLSYIPQTTSVAIIRSEVAPPPPATSTSLLSPPVKPVFDRMFSPSSPESQVFGSVGGIRTPLMGLSTAGRVYFAVRMTPTSPMSSPWYLQLIDGTDGTTVLSQVPVSGPQGVPIETYGWYDIGSIRVNTDPVFLQLVQFGPSNDSISVDTISLFDPGILWEFSVDGGATFYDATPIRNNANGIFTFPVPGTQLVWRCTGMRLNMHVTSLQIRPLYQGQISAFPSGPLHGPNVSMFDHVIPITEDPEFTMWTKPIPRSWFLAFRNQPALFPDGVPAVTEFSHFFSRPLSETVPPMTDGALRSLSLFRQGNEFLPAMSDGATRSLVIARGSAESMPAMTSGATASVYRLPAVGGMIVRPVRTLMH